MKAQAVRNTGGWQGDRQKKLSAARTAAKKAAASGTLRGNAGRKPAPKLRKQSNPDKKGR